MGFESENTAILDLGVSPALGVVGGAVGHGLPPKASQIGYYGGFDENVGTQSIYLSHNQKAPVSRIVVVLAVVLGCLGIGLLYTNGSFDQTLREFGLIESIPVQSPPRKPQARLKDIPGQRLIEVVTKANVAPSIWSEIANQGGTGTVKIGAPLSSDQRKEFDQAMASPFTYQRYKAVLELSRSLPQGSEILLQGVLQTENFWTRMRALIAIADLGGDITSEDIATALGQTSGELRARFFKRFEKSPCSVGCYFVARASLRHLDAEGRAAVLRVISNETSKIRDRYMVAASFDESELVRQTAIEWLDGHDVDPKIWRELNQKRGVTPEAEAEVPVFDAKTAKKLADTERELIELQKSQSSTNIPATAPEAAPVASPAPDSE